MERCENDSSAQCPPTLGTVYGLYEREVVSAVAQLITAVRDVNFKCRQVISHAFIFRG